MGKRGPAPKPTALKKMQGNPGRRPLNKSEPTPDPTIPRCPPHLGDEAKREWRRMAKRLAEAGLLTYVDKAGLAMYCEAWGRWVEAAAQVKKGGYVVLTKNNNPIQNPYLAIMNKAWEQMLKILREFGMTPSARSHIELNPDEDNVSLADVLWASVMNEGK